MAFLKILNPFWVCVYMYICLFVCLFAANFCDHCIDYESQCFLWCKLHSATDFLADVRSLRQRYDPSMPTLVHCSAGVGRSGVVVLMDMLMAKVDCGDVRQCFEVAVVGWTYEHHVLQCSVRRWGWLLRIDNVLLFTGTGHSSMSERPSETKDAPCSDGRTIQVCV